MNKETIQVHRIGTITCGIVLVFYGILFMIHIAMPTLDYRQIFALWPVVLVLLGIEILVGSLKKGQENQKFVYDFPAVLLIFALAIFAFIMAFVDYAMQYCWQL